MDAARNAVSILRLANDDLQANLELKKLSFRPVRRDDETRRLNKLLFELGEEFESDEFGEFFVSEGGARVLMDMLPASEGSVQSELLRAMRSLCRLAIGAYVMGTEPNIIYLHYLLSYKSSNEHSWSRSARYALEVLIELSYQGHAERIHNILLNNSNEMPYIWLSSVLKQSSTRNLLLSMSAMVFMLMIFSCVGQPEKLIFMWRRVGVQAALLSCEDTRDPVVAPLLTLCLLTVGKRFSPPREGGGNIGSVARSIWIESQQNFGTSDISQSPIFNSQTRRTIKEIVRGVVTQDVAQENRQIIALEEDSRARIHSEQLHTHQQLMTERLSDEVLCLEGELPKELEIKEELLQNLQNIGKGSFGSVFKALCSTNMEDMAVKELLPLSNECKVKQLKRERAFIKETLLLHRLRNNAIVNFYGWVRPQSHKNTIWMVTEYCPGGTLTNLIYDTKLTPHKRGDLALKVGLAIAPALAYIHGRVPQFVHLDVAARNVLVADNGTFKLGDVGSLSPAGSIDPVICIPWASPEALDKGYVAAPAYDVWSFGMLLWEVLEGDSPFRYLFDGENAPSFGSLVRKEILSGETPAPPYPVAAEDEVAEAIWDEVITECWSFESFSRPVMNELKLTLTQISHNRSKDPSVSTVFTPPDSPGSSVSPYELPSSPSFDEQERIGSALYPYCSQAQHMYPYGIRQRPTTTRFELLCTL